MDLLECQYLLICDCTYLELMNLIKLGKSWNLRSVNIMKFEVINLRMSWFLWIQVIFHAFKIIYLSIKLRLLCEECKIKKENKQCIYHIISKLGPAYSIFVSTFHSMKESLTAASYQGPGLESFCDSLIREQDKLIHLGIINNVDTSGKALLSR